MRLERKTIECPVVSSRLPSRRFSEREIALRAWAMAVEAAQDEEIKAAATASDLNLTQPLAAIDDTAQESLRTAMQSSGLID